jgi:hypothetical protein
MHLGQFNETFPWSRIGDGPDALPFWVVVGSSEQARLAVSKNCSRTHSDDAASCKQCLAILPIIDHLTQLASHPKSHTLYNLLNTCQLKELLINTKDDANRWKLKV